MLTCECVNPGIEEVIGPTIATVPIRIQSSATQTVSGYLRDLQHQVVAMVPFEQTGLQRIAQLNKSACDFQTLLVIQPTQQQSAQKNDPFGLWMTDQDQIGFTTYALTLHCTLPAGSSNEMDIRACFDSNVIRPWDMGLMLEQLCYITEQLAAAGPEVTLSQVDILTPQDRDTLWQRNAQVPEPVDRTVHTLISERALAQPHIIAVDAWDGQITYKELDTLSSRLALHLIAARGGRKGFRIPLVFEKSMWTVVGMLGAIKTGAAAVTMDVTQPEERLQVLVAQLDAEVILSSAANKTLAAKLLPQKPVLVLGKEELVQLGPPSDIRLPAVSPSDAACIVFTSGKSPHRN